MEHGKPRRAARALALLLCLLAVTGVAPIPARGEETPALGPVTHYGALLFDHFESVHGWMEGAMAVRGRAAFGTTSGSYESGLAAHRTLTGIYENPRGYPSLLCGAAPAVGMTGYSNCTVYGGPVALSQTALTAYERGNKFQIRDAAGLLAVEDGRVEAFFDDAYDAVIHSGLALDLAFSGNRRAAATLKLRDFVGWNTTAGVFDRLDRFEPDNLDSGGMRVLEIIIEDEEHVEINAPRLPAAIDSYDLVVLHFPNASSARFTGSALYLGDVQLNPYAAAGSADNQIMGRIAEKLVWHMPQVTAIQIAGHGVIGSVLAPRAYVEGSGGVINGMLVADSLRESGGMHLNRFPADERLFSLGNLDGEHPLTGSVRVVKYDPGMHRDSYRGLLLLSGAVFDLYAQNELGVWQRHSGGYETLVDGGVTIRDLPEGRYFLQETRAPDGYYLSDTRHYFTIDAGHGVESPLLLPVENRPIRLEVLARAVDVDSGEGLGGARFLLFERTGSQIELTGEVVSGEDGMLDLPELEYGGYRLVEIAPPDGYESRFHYYLDVNLEGDAHGNATVTYHHPDGQTLAYSPDEVIELPNRRIEGEGGKRLVVSKLDLDDPDTPLDGTVFSLEWRNPLGDWTLLDANLETDAYGLLEVEGLADGEYRLTELTPSVGYRAMEDVYLFHLNRSDTAVIEVYNRAVGRIIVEKVDGADPDRKLAGAGFTLYHDAGGAARGALGQIEEVASGETGADGQLHFEHLKPGRYYLVQTKSPEGYRPIESPELAGSTVVSFLLDQNGDKVIYPEEVEIEVLADPDMATVTVHKVDAAIWRAANADPAHGLPGAVFDLYVFREESHDWQLERPGIRVTRADGRVEITELPVGVYKLQERTPPASYAPDRQNGLDSVLFSVLSGDGVQDEEIVVENFRVLDTSSRAQGERVFPEGLVTLPESDNPPTGRQNWGRTLLALLLLALGRQLWRHRWKD